MERLLEAVKNILPYIHENGMEGETSFERAVLELEKAYKEAAQQSVHPTGSTDDEECCFKFAAFGVHHESCINYPASG